jgi:hypothetical protein
MIMRGLARLLGWLFAQVVFHFLVALHLSDVIAQAKKLRRKLSRSARMPA